MKTKSESAVDRKKTRTARSRTIKEKNKKFQYAKTGFQRCAMQMTITIKVPYRQYEAYGKVKTLSTRSETRTARSRTIKEKKLLYYVETSQIAIDVRRMNNGVFNAMTDEE
ncbi:hypothetical protein T01_11977 [Trichinella spiralis]|uniref:Uncharacterized protein n=1 Tax=Trichinella spiralis TaxID=6334 RepID=A0A0V1BIN4_TRISP|nr:hypothetical protein T01_11977 [Trichinella spiralis]